MRRQLAAPAAVVAICCCLPFLVGCGTDQTDNNYVLDTGVTWPPTGGTDATTGIPDVVALPDGSTPSDVQWNVDQTGTEPEDTGAPDVPDVPDIVVKPDVSDVAENPGCAKASTCKPYPDTPWCALDISQCTQCLVNFHCQTLGAGYVCEDHKCVQPSCVPAVKTCATDKFLQTCNDDGHSYTTVACPEGQPLCLDGACKMCQPLETFCSSPAPGQEKSTQLMKCNSKGSAAAIVEICKAGQFCSNGSCKVCEPGEKSCLGDKALVCREDGTGYDVSQDCGLTSLTCLAGICVSPCATDPKSKTNVGCDYWAVDLDNAKVPNGKGGFYDAQNSQYSVIISNTKAKPATVKVKVGKGEGALTATYTVQANQLKILNLPDPAWGKQPLQQDGTGFNYSVYRISSNQPIVAYQFNPLQNYDVFSNDASLLLPSNALGNEYWVMTRQQTHQDLRGFVTVVAVDPGVTKVKALVVVKTMAAGGAKPIPAGPWLNIMEFPLEQGEVMTIETNENGADLTGTWLKGDKKIAVFGGSEAANSPNTNKCVKIEGTNQGVCQNQGWPCTSNDDCPVTCCADHLEEQLFPVSSWGTTYVATRSKARGKAKDAWRILASEDGTNVATNPPQAAIPQINQGKWFEFESDQDFEIISDKPVMVGQFLASANAPEPNNDVCNSTFSGTKVCTHHMEKLNTPIACQKNSDCPNIPDADDAKIGDPAFILTVSIAQYLDEYVFLVPNKYTENYINVVGPAGTEVTLDGQGVPGANFTVFADGKWQVAVIAVAEGVHTLTSSAPVGLTVYGWSDYVSYGYPGGAKLL